MIILDANILKSASLRGPAADVLRAIRAADGERVAAPWIVMEEIAAQQALAYQRKHDTAVEAVDILRAATPWSDVPNPRKWDAEHVRKHWRERYASLAETIETSPAAYQEAMFRETNLIAPCKTVNSGKHKTGARDAAIWLTAVEYARSNPAEIVYFVSNNTEDFGDGSSFPEPMDRPGPRSCWQHELLLGGISRSTAQGSCSPRRSPTRTPTSWASSRKPTGGPRGWVWIRC
ncbi:PIN domain-containing protein [Streptomyces sp. NPDC087272]|uniref:PIN domain-containing protein n=1 Tax=Streptomyces sp. NPDC087272 TaxID=3365775 RepID=UPI00381D9CB5